MYGSLSSARLASPEDCCTRAAWLSRRLALPQVRIDAAAL